MTMTADQAILIINAGSSSVKFSVYRLVDDVMTVTINGQIQGIGSKPVFDAKDASKKLIGEHEWADPKTSMAVLLGFLFDWLHDQLHGAELLAAGHRVLHGGTKFRKPVLLTPAIIDDLEALIPWGPLHMPANVAAIRVLTEIHPELPQVACFDTAFHGTHPWQAYSFAIPREFSDEGIRRYGFHGSSYEYIASRLPEVDPVLAAGHAVVAHLGSGASISGLKNCVCMDNTMGFTPLDGLVMGTRCGSIDASVLIYLMRSRNLNADQLETLLNKKSGMLGISGVSNDMRPLMESDNPRAAEAVEMFVFHAAKHIASQAGSMGGFDGLVFTAGIGENSSEIRARICEKAAWLGITIDPELNAQRGKGARKISTADSPKPIWVIPTDEEGVIVKHTLKVYEESKAAGLF